MAKTNTFGPFLKARDDADKLELLNKLDGARVYVEHGFLTVRTQKGWLLWEQKLSQIETSIGGVPLEDLLKAAAKNVEEGS